MNRLLSDNLTYKLLKSDPTSRFHLQVNNLVKKLLDTNCIDETTAKNLKIYNSVAPKLYGLRKTHKDTLSLRPVVSCINAPSYNLAAFIHSILNQFCTTFKYNVKNSFEFV